MVTRFGLQIPNFTYPGVEDARLFSRVADIARTAEASGFDSVWVMDHLWQIPGVGPTTNAMLESYTLLGALAASTQRVRLGTMVTGVTYRNPALLAKIVTTLDVISSGRAICGIGGAWFEDEHIAFGFDFPPVAERLARLEEAVQICRAMFTQQAPTFEGRYYRVKDVLNVPRPVTPGGPPIMIGGGGERKTLRLVARYADACNFFGDVDTVRHKLDVLQKHCDEAGRARAEITATRLGTLIIASTEEEAQRKLEAFAGPQGISPERARMMAIAGDPASCAEQIAPYFDAGIEGMIFNMPDSQDLEPVALAGEMLRQHFGA